MDKRWARKVKLQGIILRSRGVYQALRKVHKWAKWNLSGTPIRSSVTGKGGGEESPKTLTTKKGGKKWRTKKANMIYQS